MKFQAEPDATCDLCSRLVDFRATIRLDHPDWFNGAVPSFGPDNASLLIVGLAPGLQGANRTGRPFTGDYAGDLLYRTLLDFDFARGTYDGRADDGLILQDCMITNAVRCVPPKNKPLGSEIGTCRNFLAQRIRALPKLKVILSLGLISHDSVVMALGGKRSHFKFGHSRRHEIDGRPVLYDSYHCSRYNTNTRRLTPEMFHAVFTSIRNELSR